MLKILIKKKIPGARQLALRLRLIREKKRGTRRPGRLFLLDILPKHSVGAEIGVFLGGFSQQIIDCTSPKELHLIDPWEYNPSTKYEDSSFGSRIKGGQMEMDLYYLDVCDRFNKEIRAERVKVHRGYSTDVLEQFPDEYFDWVYIDGNHLYEYVKKDLELSFRKTKLGGFITGDDYAEGRWWKGGVKKAVDEFSKNEAIQLVEIRNSQFILRKKS